MNKNPYTKIVLHLIPRILSNLDRDYDSPCVGSFDRNYWHYKIRDFSSAILQQSCLTLALVYKNNFQGNIYYNNKKIKDWIILGINYWSDIQLKDGSFNEYWPNEHSIPATAFSLYAICETCKILDYTNPKVLKAIKKAANFLFKNQESGALNQEIAAMTAIRNAYELIKDGRFKKMSEIKFNNILKKQSAEGWFSEYGGSDIGYLTVSLNYMVLYYKLSHDSSALRSAKKILNFIKYFIHPDGSLGGEYSTRNTQYFLPSGFELMKDYDDLAYPIIERLMNHINKDYLNLSIDERYLLHYVGFSFVIALLDYKGKKSKIKLPYKTIFKKHFKEAKIFIKSTNKYYCIISMLKGGVIKAFSKNKNKIITDVGYRIKYKNRFLVSEWIKNNKYKINNGSLRILTNFTKRNFLNSSPIKHIGLRILSFLFGRRMVDVTKNMLIFGNSKNEKESLLREIIFKDDSIEIIDKIGIKNKSELISVDGLSLRHTASSKFFQVNEMNNIHNRNKRIITDNIKFKKKYKFSN